MNSVLLTLALLVTLSNSDFLPNFIFELSLISELVLATIIIVGVTQPFSKAKVRACSTFRRAIPTDITDRTEMLL
jgi:hypothetical protein